MVQVTARRQGHQGVGAKSGLEARQMGRIECTIQGCGRQCSKVSKLARWRRQRTMDAKPAESNRIRISVHAARLAWGKGAGRVSKAAWPPLAVRICEVQGVAIAHHVQVVKRPFKQAIQIPTGQLVPQAA